VKKNDLQRVEQELFALGFMPEDRNRVIAQSIITLPTGSPGTASGLKIHWPIVPSSSLFQIDVDGFMEQVATGHTGAGRAQALSPEDYCSIFASTRPSTLMIAAQVLCDIGEVVRCYGAQLDWQRSVARSRQWGVLRAVYVDPAAGEGVCSMLLCQRNGSLHPTG